jgi:putative NADH-flavin reductase
VKVAILGATGNIGGECLRLALAAGHEIRALARDPGSLPEVPGLTVTRGEPTDAVALARALDGAEAVLHAIGPRGNTASEEEAIVAVAEAVIRGMRDAGVSRIVLLSGAAVDVPGDRKDLTGRLVSAVVRRLVPHVVAAKQRELDLVRTSGLAWTAIRPPRVVAGPPTGRTRLTFDRVRGSRVTSGDVAEAMLASLADPGLIGKAAFLSVGPPSIRGRALPSARP